MIASVGRSGVLVLCVAACGRFHFDVLADGTTTGDSTELANYAFVTSSHQLPTTFGADLSGADAICNARAVEGGLPGTYVAWLSTTTVAAKDRLAGARGWIRTDGMPFTDQVADLVASTIYYPLDRDEHKNLVTGFVLTGTNDTGGMLPNCADYSDPAQMIYFGRPEATAHGWTHESSVSCSTMGPIYCFGIDRSQPVTITPSTGRTAFLTVQSFIPDAGGLATADALCASEASNAGLSGTYRALLATTTANAISRVSITGATWVRTDGIAIASSPTELMNGLMTAPLNVSAKGIYRIANALTGAADVTTLSPGGAQNCVDWTSSGTTSRLGLPSYIDSGFFYDPAQMASCQTGKPLYCLEQ
jgi:hypothetical protein